MTIKTWRERTGCEADQTPIGVYEFAMQAEIDELRAALAQPTIITWNADGVRTVNGVPDSAQPVTPEAMQLKCCET